MNLQKYYGGVPIGTCVLTVGITMQSLFWIPFSAYQYSIFCLTNAESNHAWVLHNTDSVIVCMDRVQ